MTKVKTEMPEWIEKKITDESLRQIFRKQIMNVMIIKDNDETRLINAATFQTINCLHKSIEIELTNAHFTLQFHTEKQAIKCFNKIQDFLAGDYTTCDVSDVDGLRVCYRDYSNES